MHTRNLILAKFSPKVYGKNLLKRLSAKEKGENTMIKVNTMIAVMEMDEDELLILIVDRRDVSISIRKEERPNFPSPIPPPPYLRWSGKMEIDEFILYLYLIRISPGDFSEVLSIGKYHRQLLADEVCLSANIVEKFININGVPHEHEHEQAA